MTLKIYVTKDSNGKDWPPAMPHEMEAIEWMLKKAWLEFHHLQELFAVIVNLRNPSADMVVMREIGLGVLELKHHFGDVSINPYGIWVAGKTEIHFENYLNPREQVRFYAQKLREKTIRELLPASMQTNNKHWDELKFQTAVCFTNPLVGLGKLRRQLEEKPPRLEKWEDGFSIFDIDFFTTWVRKLRFELPKAAPKDYSLVHSKPETIIRIATRVLGGVEWEEMIAAMPVSNPYGYLILDDADGRQVYSLIKDNSTVGRSHQCDIVLPSRYARVSKHHLTIVRNVSGVTVIDQSSQNGTFVNDRQVQESVKLVHGGVLSLGGPSDGKKACTLSFGLSEMLSDETTATEQATQNISKLSDL